MEEKQGKFELVLTARQVVKVQCLICGLLCLVSATSYLVGLSNTKVEAAAPAARPAQAVKTVEVKPIDVKPIDVKPAPVPVVEKADAKALVVQTPPVGQKTEASPPLAPRLPIQGKTYFQMAAVERGVAEVFVEYLGRKGFPALLAPGPNESIYRVLVGPVEGAETFAKTQQALIDAGFTTFTRRYKPTGTTQASNPDSE